MNIHELNERRALAELRLKAIGMQNTPTDAEGMLKAAAQSRLVYDAWWAAQKEYQDAVNKLSADELMELASGGKSVETRNEAIYNADGTTTS